jgi:hypothetical protein
MPRTEVGDVAKAPEIVATKTTCSKSKKKNTSTMRTRDTKAYALDETEDSLQSPVPALNLDFDVSTESGGHAGTEMDGDRNANTMRESQFMEMSE